MLKAHRPLDSEVADSVLIKAAHSLWSCLKGCLGTGEALETEQSCALNTEKEREFNAEIEGRIKEWIINSSMCYRQDAETAESLVPKEYPSEKVNDVSDGLKCSDLETGTQTTWTRKTRDRWRGRLSAEQAKIHTIFIHTDENIGPLFERFKQDFQPEPYAAQLHSSLQYDQNLEQSSQCEHIPIKASGVTNGIEMSSSAACEHPDQPLLATKVPSARYSKARNRGRWRGILSVDSGEDLSIPTDSNSSPLTHRVKVQLLPEPPAGRIAALPHHAPAPGGATPPLAPARPAGEGGALSAGRVIWMRHSAVLRRARAPARLGAEPQPPAGPANPPPAPAPG